jgi:hypothetical protein
MMKILGRARFNFLIAALFLLYGKHGQGDFAKIFSAFTLSSLGGLPLAIFVLLVLPSILHFDNGYCARGVELSSGQSFYFSIGQSARDEHVSDPV